MRYYQTINKQTKANNTQYKHTQLTTNNNDTLTLKTVMTLCNYQLIWIPIPMQLYTCFSLKRCSQRH